MDHRDWTESELAAKSGVSQKKINNVLNNTQDTGSGICDQLARPFGLVGWQLMVKDLPEAVLRDGHTLRSLVENYISSSSEGRLMIDRVAEREAKYGANGSS